MSDTYKCATYIVIMLFWCFVIASAQGVPSDVKSVYITKAKNTLGWNEKSNQKSTVPLLVSDSVISDDNTPFLHKDIDQVSTISVTAIGFYEENENFMYEGIILGNLERDYTLTFSKSDGKLLKIESNLANGDPKYSSEPELTQYEEELTTSGLQFHGVPDEVEMSFSEALDQCRWQSQQAHSIKAYYVYIENRKSKKLVPCWIIVMRGVHPPITPRGGKPSDVPIELRNSVIQVIDAEERKLVRWQTAPHAPIEVGGEK